MRDRIPFLFAALLVAGLIAVVGVAAFSITGSQDQLEEAVVDGVVSGRVASAILAASVSAPIPAAQGGDIQAIAPQSASEPTQIPETTEAGAGSSTTVATATETTSASDTTPPPLVITSPAEGATVNSSVVEFSGTSEPGAVVTSGPFEAAMEDDGDWSIKLVVGSGYNGAVFTARDAAGNETSVRVTVLYEVSTSPTTTRAPSPPPTTTSAPTPTTSSPPPSSNCPVSGACSPQWPADPKQGHGREYWRWAVEKHWGAARTECVLDLIQVESGGDPQARAPAGYLGLMQHSPWGWNSRAKSADFFDGSLTAHPYNGEANIAAGAALANLEGPDWWKHWPPTYKHKGTGIPSCQVHVNG